MPQSPDKVGWTVYLVQCADATLYCGVTTDISRRMEEHNGLQPGGARYTRTRRPVRLLAAVQVADRSAACRLEEAVKRKPRAEKVAFLLQAAE